MDFVGEHREKMTNNMDEKQQVTQREKQERLESGGGGERGKNIERSSGF